MTMFETVHLKLLIGPNIPEPAPSTVVDALVSVEVRNNDSGRDGFQMNFSMGRKSPADYDLLRTGLPGEFSSLLGFPIPVNLPTVLDPPARVILVVYLGAEFQVLIDGIITHQQGSPSNKPGEGSLVVTGEDISLKLHLEEKRATYPNQSDSDIVTS